MDSDAINSLSPDAERFFLRLCLAADDYGRFDARPALLKSQLFPLRENLRSTDIAAWLAECEKTGLVRCYEVAGKRYLLIPKFNQRLRIKKAKFPDPPIAVNTALSKTSLSVPKTKSLTRSTLPAPGAAANRKVS